MGDILRRRRLVPWRRVGCSWYVDETTLTVQGRWCSLYHAVDRNGGPIDTMPSEIREMTAAKRFF
jgi:putative transposase